MCDLFSSSKDILIYTDYYFPAGASLEFKYATLFPVLPVDYFSLPTHHIGNSFSTLSLKISVFIKFKNAYTVDNLDKTLVVTRYSSDKDPLLCLVLNVTFQPLSVNV